MSGGRKMHYLPLNRSGIAIAAMVPLCMILALSSRDNALFDTAKELQAQTITPVISVRLADGTVQHRITGALLILAMLLSLNPRKWNSPSRTTARQRLPLPIAMLQ
ncbi:MAG: hypothetical protein CVV51_11555 [Spirochaetae bacterium HGW-Spirochaetae-7]|nr:MAG: hypothetical protein CVV51_11555 [Spirochaetae bacterium HGW-Spirochaetae-7]